MQTDPNLPTMQGARWRATHKASVVAILGVAAPPVYSKGSKFYNVDRWTLRILVEKMCEWAKANPKAVPLRTDVAAWVRAANAEPMKGERHIVIAATPARLSLRVALALVGGGYHEALHTDMSCRRDLSPDEVADVVLPRWAKVPDWSKFYGLLQEWNNVVEDIRIERRGNEKYVGIYQKMCELQDFILGQEAADRQKVLDKHGAKGLELLKKPLPIVTGTFRDLGLGYETADQETALRGYRDRNPDAVDLVENGTLRPLLDESIDLTREDVLGCLRVAMDVIAELHRLVDPEDLEKASQQAAGCGGKPQCPKCGAPGKDLVVRPLSNGQGGVVRGRGVITCTKCGWQEVVDLTMSGGGGGGGGGGQGQGQGGGQQATDPDDLVRFDPTPADVGADSGDEGEGDGGGSQPGSGKGEEGGGKGGKGSGKDGEDGDEEGEGKGGKGSGEGEGGGDNDEGGGGQGGTHDGNKDSDGEPAQGAGGHHWDPERAKAWEVVAQGALKDAENGGKAGLQDVSTALAEAFKAVRKKEKADCAKDEKPWRPYNQQQDVVELVGESDKGIADDRERASKLVESVRSECAYLRARLRAIVRAVEQRSVIHGTPRGKEISDRMLVDSVAALRGGKRPNRAYYVVGDKTDTSIAAVAVIDESSSMAWGATKLQDATRALIAIAEPLDFLGAATLVAGFRDGPSNLSAEDYAALREEDYHRVQGVCMDVFKTFTERFSAVKWRFANTRGVGGTPMSDGIQFGLDVLNERTEAHRLLFIVTDGDPNGGHEPVIRRQVRLAKDAGIVVLGVGIGNDCKRVMTLFPDHAWAPSVEDLPKEIVRKLTEVLDFRGLKRGKRMAKSS